MNYLKFGSALDFLALFFVATALWSGSPIGGFLEKSLRAAIEKEAASVPMDIYFNVNPEKAITWVVDPMELVFPLRKIKPQDRNLEEAAHEAGISFSFARAFASVASENRIAADPAKKKYYDIRTLEHHYKDRISLGLAPGLEGGDAILKEGLQRRVEEHLELVAAYRDVLGALDAALAAWSLGLQIVEKATDKAVIAGMEDASKLESFGFFLSRKNFEKAASFVKPVRALETVYDMQWPVDEKYPLTRFFEAGTHPVTGKPLLHAGLDLGAPEGSPVYAIAPGKVVYSGRTPGGTMDIIADHGYGIRSIYSHLSVLNLNTGDLFEGGEQAGRSGICPVSDLPHLHFEFHLENHPINPLILRNPQKRIPIDLKGPATPPPRINPGMHP